MPRCQCGATTCACAVIAGEGIGVSGVGSASQPYVITNLRGDALSRLQVIDTDSVDLTLNAVVPGDENSAYTLQADATMSMADLTDVNGNDVPAVGDTPVWDGTMWQFQPAAAAGNFVKKTGDTMSGGLTVASPDGITVDAPENAFFAIDRGTDQDFAQFEFRTAGNQDFVLGSIGAGPDRVFRLYVNGGEFDALHVDRNDGDFHFLNGADVLLDHDPTLPLEAATKAYVDAHAGGGGGGVLTPAEPYYAASRMCSTALSVPNGGAATIIPFDTEVYSENIAWESAGNLFRIPVDGYYHVSATMTYAVNATGARVGYIVVNSGGVIQSYESPDTDREASCVVSGTVKCKAGDYVTIRTYQNSGAALALNAVPINNVVSIVKVPSPGGVPTAEKVYASRRSISANVSIPNNVETPLVLDQLVTDDGIPWATSGWIIPVTGWYQINALVGWLANATGVRQVKITQNGASTTYNNVPATTTSTGGSAWSRALKCTAGDIINISVLQNSGAALSTNQVTVDIHKIPETIPASNGIIGERVYAAVRNTNSAQSIPNGSAKVNFDNLERSDGIAWDATNLGYVIPVSGWYDLAGSAQFGSNATGYRILYFSADGVTLGAMSETGMTTSGGQSVSLSKSVYLLAGQIVSLTVTQTSGAALALTANATYNFFSITKIPSVFPQSVALGEKTYSISYRQAAAVSCTNGTIVQVPWDTLDYSEGGITKDGAGNFTVPVAGYYQVNAKVAWDANGNGYRRIRIGINTTSGVPGYGFAIPTANGTPTTQVSRTVKLAAGDTIAVSIDQGSGGTLATIASTPNNSIDITKVPAPVVAGSAASGIWGTAPLTTGTFGTDDLIGNEVYVDSRGQLRSKPNLVMTLPVTTLAPNWPAGTSVMYIPSADAPNWPTGVSGVVVTHKTSNNVIAQWCSPWTAAKTEVWYRNGTSTAWSPWQKVAGEGLNKKMAAGRVQVTVTNAISGTVAVTFPAGLFTTAPRVAVTSVGSSVWVPYSANAPTTSGFSAGARHVDATVSTGTVNIDWIAIEE